MSKIELIQGDCLEKMKDIPDNSVDMVLTSPPYDNLRSYKDSLDWGEHIWKPVIEELFRVIKKGGVVVWVVGDSTFKGSETGTSFKQALWAKECGFNLHDTMIYQKITCAMPSPNRYLSNFEYMFVFSSGKPKTYNLIEDRKNRFPERWGKGRKVRKKDGSWSYRENYKAKEYGRRFNIWQYNNGGQGYGSSDKFANEHPATFPEQLAHDHIISWSNEGDMILDPFAGSGTVGKMAKQLNRNCILIEKVEEYFKIAEKRITEASDSNLMEFEEAYEIGYEILWQGEPE
jgi:site-specific DNA-methyltransferase (adenine-specific)